MEIIFSILFLVLWAYLCYHIASENGRDTVIAAILGALFGVFAVVGYLIAGKKEAKVPSSEGAK